MTLIITEVEVGPDNEEQTTKVPVKKSKIPRPCAPPPITRVVKSTEDISTNNTPDQAYDWYNVVMNEYLPEQTPGNIAYKENYQTNDQSNIHSNIVPLNESIAHIFATSSTHTRTAKVLAQADLEIIRAKALNQELLIVKKSIENSLRNLEEENKIKEINTLQAADRERGRLCYRIFEKSRRVTEYHEKKRLFGEGACDVEEVEMARARMERYHIRGNKTLEEMERKAEDAERSLKAAVATREEANAALEATRKKNENAEECLKVAKEMNEKAKLALGEAKREKDEVKILLRKVQRYKIKGEGFFLQARGYKEVAEKDLEEGKEYKTSADNTWERAAIDREEARIHKAEAHVKLEDGKKFKVAADETLEEARISNEQAKSYLEEAKKVKEQTVEKEVSSSKGKTESCVCEKLRVRQTKKDVIETIEGKEYMNGAMVIRMPFHIDPRDTLSRKLWSDNYTPAKYLLFNLVPNAFCYMTVRLLEFWCGENSVEFFLRLFAFVVVLGLVWFLVASQYADEVLGMDGGDKEDLESVTSSL